MPSSNFGAGTQRAQEKDEQKRDAGQKPSYICILGPYKPPEVWLSQNTSLKELLPKLWEEAWKQDPAWIYSLTPAAYQPEVAWTGVRLNLECCVEPCGKIERFAQELKFQLCKLSPEIAEATIEGICEQLGKELRAKKESSNA
jgi:hypothetical protein